MKVIDFGDKYATVYRYRVDVGRDNMASLDVARVWADNNNISCAILPGLAFFHHEQDVVMFMLRWS